MFDDIRTYISHQTDFNAFFLLMRFKVKYRKVSQWLYNLSITESQFNFKSFQKWTYGELVSV